MEEKWQTITGLLCLVGYLFCATRVYRYVLNGRGKRRMKPKTHKKEDMNNLTKTTKQNTKRKEEV